MADPIIPLNGGQPTTPVRRILGGGGAIKTGTSNPNISAFGSVVDFLFPTGTNKDFDMRFQALSADILSLHAASSGAALRLSERTDPSAPGTNEAYIYVRDNGAAKSQLCVRFATGAIQVIATEP